jgi:hypothetical protein
VQKSDKVFPTFCDAHENKNSRNVERLAAQSGFLRTIVEQACSADFAAGWKMAKWSRGTLLDLPRYNSMKVPHLGQFSNSCRFFYQLRTVVSQGENFDIHCRTGEAVIITSFRTVLDRACKGEYAVGQIFSITWKEIGWADQYAQLCSVTLPCLSSCL